VRQPLVAQRRDRLERARRFVVQLDGIGRRVEAATDDASRIEGMTKMYGARFLVSGETRAGAGEGFTFREVDRVQAKGKARPVLDVDDDDVRAAKLAALPRYTEALALYQARSFAEARAIFSDLAKDAPADVVLAIYVERCDEHLRAPPPDGWDGVVKLSTK